MAEEKIYANGFFFKKNDNAPDFVIGKQLIKVNEAVAFLQANQNNGWVNLDIKQGQSGKYYLELDTWKPKETANAGGYNPKSTTGDLPF